LLFLLAALTTLVSLFGPLSASGIWDPPELKVSDLARRIALNLLGATGLSLEGAVNTVPSLGELARGQLPFTSVAVGFRLFGLHEWAGRLPLAVWGLAGIWATYALIARLADRAAGAFAALVLATMPLYFLHARTILGEIVTMSALALAVAGLGIACFDRPRAGEKRGVRRALWLLLGCVGLGAGFGARGL
jgi:4-amino-4-deoxy-L-arabinose transferase-like glycosyltransferase